jgi:hypothetical protein
MDAGTPKTSHRFRSIRLAPIFGPICAVRHGFPEIRNHADLRKRFSTGLSVGSVDRETRDVHDRGVHLSVTSGTLALTSFG